MVYLHGKGVAGGVGGGMVKEELDEKMRGIYTEGEVGEWWWWFIFPRARRFSFLSQALTNVNEVSHLVRKVWEGEEGERGGEGVEKRCEKKEGGRERERERERERKRQREKERSCWGETYEL